MDGAFQQLLFVLNVTDCSMHELDSLDIGARSTPINLRYSFIVIMVIINWMDEQRRSIISKAIDVGIYLLAKHLCIQHIIMHTNRCIMSC